MKTLLKKAIPHLIAILSFAIISTAFYSPAITGKNLRMGDINQWKGMSKEINDYRIKTGEEPLWTNSMFGGMPATQISVSDTGNLVKKLDLVYKLGLPRPIDILFKAMLGFYILLMCMRVNPVIGAIGAISFGLSSFFILYLGAGHASKMNAIVYIAPMIGGMIYSFRQNALKGAAITAIFLCFHLGANHLQMTYYALFLVGIIGIGELIRKFIKSETNSIPKVVGFLLVATLLGLAPNYASLSTTAEYGEYSTRGTSDLTMVPDSDGINSTNQEGLGKDYILEYSMAYGEWFSAYSPNVKGGKTNLLVNVPEAKKAINKKSQQFLGQNQILSYWGEQRGTAGAFYFGALMFFLALCGLFFLKDNLKWSLLVIAIISILASWKLGGIPDFFIDNVPLWNKFRDTKMMLILLMIIVPLLGSLFLNQFVFDEEFRSSAKRKILYFGGGFALLNIILISSPSSLFDFISSAENTAFSALSESKEGRDMLGQIVAGRQAIFTADITRSFMISLLGLGLLYLSLAKKEYTTYILYGLGLIFVVDLWTVDQRYFDSKTGFENEIESRVPFAAQNVEKQILTLEKGQIEGFDAKVTEATKLYQENTGDKRNNNAKKLQREIEVLNQNSNYRVLNLGNPWSDSRTSYYHKSIGGYHGAKLKIYQEMIDFHLGSEAKNILDQLQSTGNIDGEYPILSMLNTKYLIGNPEGNIIPFNKGLGNSWFVKSIDKVSNADEEMKSLKGFSPDSVAIIQNQYAENLANSYSGIGRIELTDYKPNQLTYQVNTSEKQFAVFSEIYYPAGWNAYVDGNISNHVKVDYILRGLEIPGGTNEVIFKFEPDTYYSGRAISLGGSIVLILLCMGLLVQGFRKLELTKENS